MPRKDRTFSDNDVIRIIEKHLTLEERENVLIRLGTLLIPAADVKMPEAMKMGLVKTILQRISDTLAPIILVVDGLSLIPVIGSRIKAVSLALKGIQAGVKLALSLF